jgi:flavin-dependent dehydrogenase
MDYDVIIVGGRPSGAALAIRLGREGWRVLLLERNTFPSPPAVSSPMIYSPVMTLLDELDVNEGCYAYNTPKVQRVIYYTDATEAEVEIPEVNGRNYGYAIDRARFDNTLWEKALSYPTVVGIQDFNVTDLVWDGDKVTGIVGSSNGQEKRFTSAIVVGADGRYSFVARKVGTQTQDEQTDFPTSIYYAYWKNVQPHDDKGAAMAVYPADYGYVCSIFDSADNTSAVILQGQAALLDPKGNKPEQFYENLVLSNARVVSRLKNAERVTSVRGMKFIGNLYRQPGGKGWALVGDAYYQKDPADGQGIFDALFTAKSLAYALKKWKSREMSWDKALEWYDETVRIKTYGMYKSLPLLSQAGFYNQLPQNLKDLLSEWMYTDKHFQSFIGKYLTRQIPGELLPVVSPVVAFSALIRGAARQAARSLNR